MKLSILLVGAVFCLTAQTASKSSQEGSTNKPAASAQPSLTGCIDEQMGKYVLLDGQMVKIAGLQSAGLAKGVFAKYVGHKVIVRGTQSPDPKGPFTVTRIEQISDDCGTQK